MQTLEKLLGSTVLLGSLQGCQQDFGLIVNREVREDFKDTEDTQEYEEHLDCPWLESFVQKDGIYGTDILWAIDKSGSMSEYTEEKILNGITSMLDALPPLGWQIFMFALHPDAAYDQQPPLLPGATRTDVEDRYDHMSRGSITSEKGFEAVQTFTENNGYARSLLRPDATLLTVFVSDEDDESYDEELSDEEAADLFVGWYDAKQEHKALTSIVINEDSTCGSGASERGTRYINATTYFEGTLLDFCADSWEAGVRDVANAIEPYGYERLEYVSIENTIRVFVDEQLQERDVDWTYDLQKNTVFFQNIPETGSSVDIIYNIDTRSTNNVCPAGTE